MSIFSPDKLSQAINPWSWWLKLTDNVNGLVNIVTYKSNNHDTEQKIVQEVAGYGMQLDSIENVLTILLNHLPKNNLSKEQKEQIDEFHQMLDKIEKAKQDIILEQLSGSNINKFIDNLSLLKEKYPKRYDEIAERLKKFL